MTRDLLGHTFRSFMLSLLVPCIARADDEQVVVTGELREWHKVTLGMEGPFASEEGTPNPFMDSRLDVTFTCDDRRYVVPGYFAADGDAAESGADSGNQWRVHFRPDATGTWGYRISFLAGAGIAVSEDLSTGTPVEPLHGLEGSFEVGPTDKTGRDNRARGRLRYGLLHCDLARDVTLLGAGILSR